MKPMKLRKYLSPQRLRQWAKDSPAWAISIGLHLAIGIGATLFYFGEKYLSDDDGIWDVGIKGAELPKIADLKSPDAAAEKKGAEDAAPESQDQTLADVDAGNDDSSGSDPLASDGGSGAGGGGIPDVMGVMSGTGTRPGGGRKPGRPRKKRAAIKKEEAEKTPVEAALRWLARHQNADGSWSATRFEKNCGRHGVREDCGGGAFSGNEQYGVGVSALALLALLGGGHLPSSTEHVIAEGKDIGDLNEALGEGKALTYGDVLKRAIQSLMRQQADSGMIGPDVDRSIYNHVLAALALCEAYALTSVPVIRDRASLAIEYLINSKSLNLGWRYGYRSTDSDSSVTGWAVFAIKSAEAAGISFESSVYEPALKWFDQVTVKATIDPRLLGRPAQVEGSDAPQPSFLLTGYQGTDDAGKLVSVPGVNDEYHYTPSMTASMIITNRFLDRGSSPKADEAIETILSFPPVRWNPREKESWKLADFYYWYHATLALHLSMPAEDARWKHWCEALDAALEGSQNMRDSRGLCREGSWEPVDRWSCEGGRVYATAMAALTLQIRGRLQGLAALPKPPRPLRVDGR